MTGHKADCLVLKPMKSGIRQPYCNCGWEQVKGRLLNRLKYYER